MKPMKITFHFLSVFLLVGTLCGCDDSEGNSLATDGASVDDFAQYEADLAAVTAAEDNEDTGDEDAE